MKSETRAAHWFPILEHPANLKAQKKIRLDKGPFFEIRDCVDIAIHTQFTRNSHAIHTQS